MPNFNSKQYEWADVKIVILGREVAGIQGIEYTVKKEKSYSYGRGNDPHSIQHGKKSVEGTLMLLQSEMEALDELARSVNPDYDLTDIEFDVAVAYGQGNTLKRDIILTVSITEDPRSISNDDVFMELEAPFMALGVKRSV